jgi:hypothetical protein
VTRLFVQSYVLLAWTGVVLRLCGLKRLLLEVDRPIRADAGSPGLAPRIARAVDLACTFYPRRALCLQRSIATALLMRRHGIQARLVLGARLVPFKAHAWVEVDRIPVNDKPYMREIYQVLDRAETLQ